MSIHEELDLPEILTDDWGWWFRFRDSGEYGPFETLEECESELEDYVKANERV